MLIVIDTTDVPVSVPSSVYRGLSLSWNDLEEVPDDTLEGMIQLKYVQGIRH